MNFDFKKLLADPWPFMTAWIIGGILTIWIPVRKWKRASQEYYDSYGYAVEYENQQRAYEEQQNGNNNNNNNNNNYYNYPNCHWWQYKCRMTQFQYRQNRDGNNNNDDGEYQLQYPGWWVFLGGKTEEDQRWAEEQGMDVTESGSSGALKFVYAWSIIMFCSILFYGGYVLVKQRPVGPLLIMLFMFLQFSILSMVLLCQGVLLTDERDLEDSVYGWFGQIGVLMVYTDYAYLWFTFVFSVSFLARAFWKRQAQKEDAQETKSDSYYAANDYEARGTMT
jgi:hypothetical protein